MFDFGSLVSQFMLLVGVAAVIGALINVGKRFLPSFFPDGSAPTWSLYLNLGAFAAFVALRLFAPDVDVAGLDANAQATADLLIYFLGFISQLGGSKVANAALRGTPVVGFSHSG